MILPRAVLGVMDRWRYRLLIDLIAVAMQRGRVAFLRTRLRRCNRHESRQNTNPSRARNSPLLARRTTKPARFTSRLTSSLARRDAMRFQPDLGNCRSSNTGEVAIARINSLLFESSEDVRQKITTRVPAGARRARQPRTVRNPARSAEHRRLRNPPAHDQMCLEKHPKILPTTWRAMAVINPQANRRILKTPMNTVF